MSDAVAAAKSAGTEAQHHAAPWIERLARVGYAAKGFIYVLIGVLAMRAAFSGSGDGKTTGSKGALATLADEGTFSLIVLWIVAIGLVGYALWNLFRAIMDPENEGNDKKGIAKRVFFGISAVIHASLAFWVFKTLLSSSGGSGGESGGTQGLVQSVLEWGVVGQVVVAAVGLGIGGFAVQQLIKAYKVDLSDELMYGKMSRTTQKVTTISGRLGLAARGVVFLVVAAFIVTAALQSDSSEAGGLSDAMKKVGTYGPIVLGFIAVGMAAYGVYMFIKARYRRIEAE